jgi:catechol 2,3-dioxygenase-like lactoylglutathione lyase family enzyme
MATSPLRDATIHTALPASDVDRAKQFFSEKLGLEPERDTGSVAIYAGREGRLAVFPSGGKASGEHTQVAWTVTDIETVVAALRDRGVVFDEYDYPDFKTVNGVATFGSSRFAWFKDSEGNVHSLEQHE